MPADAAEIVRLAEKKAELEARAIQCEWKADVELSWALMPTVAPSTIRERAAAAAALMTCAAALRARAAQHDREVG